MVVLCSQNPSCIDLLLKFQIWSGNKILTYLKNMIVSRVLYALPAFYGFILLSDVDRINAMFRKAKRWGIITDELDLDGPPIYFG